MAIKLTEWRLKMNENIGSVLSKLNSAADKTSSKMGAVQNKLNSAKLTTFTNEIPQAGRALDLLTSGYALAGAGAAAAGALMYKSGEAAMSYETSMAKINATAQLTQPQLNALKNELMGIGENSGGNFMRIPDAFEKINSSVNNVGKSLEILKVASRGAQAGFADIDLVGGALAQTMSVLGNKASATEIMDAMFGAKKAGNAEFGDIANYLPSLIASGDNMNINYKDVAGMFSFLTGKVDASSSAMYLQNAFTAMGKSEIQQGFAKQGLNLFDKKGNMKDLGEFFMELKTKLNKFSAEGKSNFLEAVGLKDAQAKSAFSFMATDAENLKRIIGEVRDSTSEMNTEFDMTANKTRSWSEIGDKLNAWKVSFGDYILPIIDKMIKGAEQLYKNAQKVDPTTMDVYKQQADEKLAYKYADDEMKKKHGIGLPDHAKHATGKLKDEYQDNYSFMLAKLTGKAFGGDYNKWKMEQQALNTPKPLERKEKFEKSSKKKNIKEGIDGINEGGKAPRIINVNFGKLNENIIIQPQTLKEGTGEVALNLEEMLVRVIEGTETSVANE